MKGLRFVARWVVVLCIVVQPAALRAQGQAKTMSATGTVKSVSGNSLTISAAGGKEMSFAVDSTTKFVGKGLGTKQAKQGKLTAPDAVAINDRVTVKYSDIGGTMHASNVRVTSKAFTTKR
jgi:hypothetical protein